MQDASGWVEELLRELDPESDAEVRSAHPGIAYSKVLGRAVRTGPWEDQKISTYDKAREALEAEDLVGAAAMLDMFYDEAEIIFSFFRQMIPDAMEYLKGRGMAIDELRDLNARLLQLLALPDGRHFNSRRLWEDFRQHHRRMLLLCGAGSVTQALDELPDYKERWRQIQDRDVDHLYGLINEVVERYGEEALGAFWESIIGPLFSLRYAKF